MLRSALRLAGDPGATTTTDTRSGECSVVFGFSLQTVACGAGLRGQITTSRGRDADRRAAAGGSGIDRCRTSSGGYSAKGIRRACMRMMRGRRVGSARPIPLDLHHVNGVRDDNRHREPRAALSELSRAGRGRGGWPAPGCDAYYAAAAPSVAKYRRQYAPPASSSSSCVPCSMIRPPSSTTIRPAWRIVLRRWAMTTAVRPASRRRRPSSMRPSVWRSTFEVASSRIRMRGSAASARANATSWRWPADSCVPRSPTSVS